MANLENKSPVGLKEMVDSDQEKNALLEEKNEKKTGARS